MKNKKMTIILIIMLGIFSFVGFAFNERYGEAANDLSLTIDSPKRTYQLGEMIRIDAKIKNNTSMPVYVEGNSYNPVAIKIAFKEDKDYKLYAPPVSAVNSISLDGINIPIKINLQETLSTQSIILWNDKPETSGLSDRVASQMTDGRIISDYAVTITGTYFIKFCLVAQLNGKSVKLESEPIKIKIVKPVGNDLEVWNKIKNNGDIGYFLQEGEIVRGRYYKPEEREKFLNEVDQIINQYPSSFYAESLQQSLDKFQAAEAKRQESLQKLKQKQP